MDIGLIDGNKNKYCNFCKKKGHIEKDCWKKHGKGKVKGGGKGKDKGKNNQPFKGRCHGCGEPGHLKKDCPHKDKNKDKDKKKGSQEEPER